MQEEEVVDIMKSEFRRIFYQGIQKWKKRNPKKRIHEIPQDAVIAALLNAAREKIHPNTRWSDIPTDLAERIFFCTISGMGPRYVLDKIYEAMTAPVNWTSFSMGVLA
ncbi:MAG: hypothetical protein WC472_03690 [Candidatus Paceibacterota bacterium]